MKIHCAECGAETVHRLQSNNGKDQMHFVCTICGANLVTNYDHSVFEKLKERETEEES